MQRMRFHVCTVQDFPALCAAIPVAYFDPSIQQIGQRICTVSYRIEPGFDGEGSLRANGHTVGYYSTATASVGWQIGAQSRAIVFLFMTDESLRRFRSTDGWSAGGDASVAVLKVGANGNVDTSTVTGQVEALVLTNTGLMAGASLEGTKVTRLNSL
ncbi:hypothetical protein LMG27952_07660 [Paraburkholderia hiiakae]|uniref:Ysc84 actin-binding domain-containing protein n=1 Tax=Paraburkholderia hiiakae TaxID=1081782 RepID=A0ABM8PBN2_9BURK|nr:YSC84-related protein [Paraburkholderia hiiakae]CAD6562037.1 hypothetical protein LMG27952_07660 [Paraburkholderia hiiakae]